MSTAPSPTSTLDSLPVEKDRRPWVVAALLLSIFLAAMEATVVATAMPTVVAELGGFHLYGWGAAVYLLGSTVFVPIYGKLADRQGRKPVLLTGIGLFLLGSLLSGLSQSIEQLIAWRAVQGIGAGAVQPIVLTIIGDLYTPAERGRIQGFFGAVWGIAGVSGPLVGGAIVAATSWRWIFLVNLPFGILAMLALIFVYHEAPRTEARPPLDLLGAATICSGSTAALLAASGVAPLMSGALAMLLFASFAKIEARAADPILPLSLLRRRLITVTTLATMFFGAAMTGMVTYLPLQVQGVSLGSPTEAGIAIAPMLIGWPIAAALTSRALMRIGYRRPVWIGGALIVATCALMVLLIRVDAAHVFYALSMFVLGLGMGFFNTATIIGIQASVEWSQRGVATATNMFARSMGGALGAGLLGALLADGMDGRVDANTVSQLLDPDSRELTMQIPGLTQVLADAVHPLFWVVAAFALLGGMVSLLHPTDAQKSS